jgi:hypothetical protein
MPLLTGCSWSWGTLGNLIDVCFCVNHDNFEAYQIVTSSKVKWKVTRKTFGGLGSGAEHATYDLEQGILPFSLLLLFRYLNWWAMRPFLALTSVNL